MPFEQNLAKLIHSETATINGIDNTPPDNILKNLANLYFHILAPTFKHFGGTPDITSGFRCQKLNQLIGGKEDSQHCHGEAVDFGIIDTDIFEIASWMKVNLEFDVLILEKYNPQDLNKGWIHCSYTTRRPNRQMLQTYDGQFYHDGLLKLPIRSA